MMEKVTRALHEIRLLSKSKFTRVLVPICFIAVLLLVLLNRTFIYPVFAKLLISNAIIEAQHVAESVASSKGIKMIEAQHVAGSAAFSKGIKGVEIQGDVLAEDLKKELDQLLKENLGLMKLKVLSGLGEVVYSTDPEEVGAINKERHFYDVVAKGGTYSRVVRVIDESLEGQSASADVVEVYVPIMKDGRFLAAFEIYYDITARLSNLDRLFSYSVALSFVIATSLLAVVIVVSFKAADDEYALKRSARQQTALAELGSIALDNGEIQNLMDGAVRLSAEALDADLCEILKVEDSGERLRLVASAGYPKGFADSALFSTELESQAGYTLRVGEPLMVEDLEAEGRFTVSPLLLKQGAVSGLSIPMVAGALLFGVLSVHTKQRRSFSREDANFLETVAGIVTTAALRDEVEEELRQAHASAVVTEKLAAIGRLTAGVTHEILNPLTGIILGLYMLARNPRIPEDVSSDLLEMEEQAERITRIVQDLLYFARHREPKRRSVDFNEMVRRTLGLLDHDLKLSNVDVELTLAEDLPSVAADQDQLQQVVLNLLTNARDAMPDGGRILMKTAEPKPLFRNEAKAVELRVEDTGDGIDAEHMDKIFDPFFTTKPEGKGTGLGLSICSGIVEAHGGSIWAENVAEGGASFVVRLGAEERN